MDQEAGQTNKASSKTSERQAQANRLVSSYRQEANVLLKEVLRAQNRWRNELQQELGVLAGIPNMKPYVRAQPHVRRRIEWKASERDALKKHLLGLGLGRWKEIHAVLEKSLRGFRHGPGDVEDACWQLLGEVQLLLTAPEDRLYVARLMDPIADRGPVWTPGAGYTKLQATAKSILRRLALLEEFNALMPALLRSEAVAGYFRALAHTTLPAAAAPAPWWDVECDVALMAGMYRHGYANFEAIRKDTYFEQAFQGFHPLQDPTARGKPAASRADTPAEAGTAPTTPAADTAEAEDKQQACSPTAGSAGHTAAADVQAPAIPAGTYHSNAWPSPEALTKRARKLIDLLGQAVAIAEELGLLQPLPDSELTGQAAADAALKGQFKEPGTYKARAAQPSSAAAADGIGGGMTTAEAAAAAGAAPWSQPGSPDVQDLATDLALLDDGGIDDLILDGDLDGIHQEPVYGRQEEEEEELNWEEEQYEDAAAAGGDSDAWQQQQLAKRGRGGRVRKPSVVAAEAAETEDVVGAAVAAAAAGADSGATGRRRVHRPSKRLAEHVVYNVADAGDGGADWTAKGEGGGGHVTKKVRKDLLDLIMIWGLPPTVAPEDPVAAAAGGEGEYDWEGWYGSSCFTPALKKLGAQDLTLVLKELRMELEEFNNAAAAAGASKPKNQHNPNCECVVCTNRRRFEERKQQEAAAAAVAAAAAAGASEEEQQAAAAAAVAALQSKDEAAEAQEDKHKPKVQMPQGEVLTALTASRLQERLETLDAFNAATQMLGNPALDAAFKRGSKDLPGWWAAEHDEALILGVLQYGFGNWGPIFEDPNMPFKAAAMAAIAAGLEDNAGGSKAKGKGGSKATSDLPSWVPDPKVLCKRCKTLVTVIKKILAKPPPAQKQPTGKGGHGGKGGGGAAGKGLQSTQAGGLAAAQNPAAAALQMQQLAAMGLLRPGMVQQIGPGAPGAVTTQQQQQQMYLAQQQQQQQASVLGKRTAGMAGLPSGPEAAAGAAAVAPTATRSAATTPTLSDRAAPTGMRSSTAAAAGAGTAVAAGPAAAVIVTAGPTIAAAVAQAANPPLSASQVQALEQLPRLVRDARSRPVLPLMLSKDLTLLTLGRIEPSRPDFHTASHIFPIGYSCSVKSLSSVTPGAQVTYSCAIADGGTSGPLFVVMARDNASQQWVAATAAAVWQQVQERVQQVQQQAVPVDGFDMFGLNHPLVSMLIQELPGADHCKGFSAAQSAAPPQMATAIKQCQHIMAQRMQQLPAAALAAATGGARTAAAQDAQQQQQAQALQAQLLQQQLARMQGGQAPSQQQQAGGVLQSATLQSSQQQQMVQLLQQRQALHQQQVLLQQQLALKQQQAEDVNKRRRTSGTGEASAGGTPTGQQSAQMAAAAAAAAAAGGAAPGQLMPGMAQQLLMLQQQQQRAAAAGGAQVAQVAFMQQQQGQLQQQQQQQQQQYLQQLSHQQQQALLQQLAAGRQQQQQPR